MRTTAAHRAAVRTNLMKGHGQPAPFWGGSLQRRGKPRSQLVAWLLQNQQ